jgi:hypothetical protein
MPAPAKRLLSRLAAIRKNRQACQDGLSQPGSVRKPSAAARRFQPAGIMTTPLSLGQRTRQANAMSLASPGLASNAHSSTPRRSRRLVAVGGVVDGSISTTMSSSSLTALVRMKPKPHEDMKVGKEETKKKKQESCLS